MHRLSSFSTIIWTMLLFQTACIVNFTTATDLSASGWSVQLFLDTMQEGKGRVTTDKVLEAKGKSEEEDTDANSAIRIADPDNILTFEEKESLGKKIQSFEATETILVDEHPHPIQIVFSLLTKMDLTPFRQFDDKEGIAAEAFATSLHDSWGVGHQTSTGGTGVVLFLSVQDRIMYVSRGGAIQGILTDGRIDRLIGSLRPYLRESKYALALEYAMDGIAQILKDGEPSFSERFWDVWVPTLFPFVAFFSVFAAMFVSYGKEQNERRTYAQVASQLSQLDRTRAEALQGQYQATSCPICLEDFKSYTVGSDDQPIKLLRCGHVFDESCWAEWVSSGQGTITKCPICKKDIGGADDENTNREATRRATDGPAPGAPQDQTRETTANSSNDEFGNSNNNNNETTEEVVDDRGVVDRRDGNFAVRALRQYNQERNFRLQRLAYRFPRYVGPQQIQRWTQSTYDGSLARDSSFVQSDPSRQHMDAGRMGGRHASSSSGLRHSGFGGGSSSGGRGGSW